MTIAYIMRYWPVYGGGETVTVTLANELVKRGHKVHILYAYRNDIKPMPYLIDRRIKEVKLNTVDYSENHVNVMGNYLKENHIDVMVNQWGDQRLCYEAKHLSGTKLIICWHMCLIREQQPKSNKQKLYRFIMGYRGYQRWRTHVQMKMHLENYRMSDSYVFLSKTYEQEFLNLAGHKINADKLASVPNPLSYDHRYDINCYPEKTKEVLFVGRLMEDHKRLSYILRIWELIEADHRLKDWNLRIVGDGPAMQETRQLCADLGLRRVSFEGFKDPQPYYNQASLFMMTSAFEGFPMTLVESLQNAVVPIVMDSFSALHDVIINEENGIIVENNDIEGFVCAMKRLMTDDAYRKRLAIKGLETCQEFALGKIVDRWELLFDEIRNSGKAKER